MVIEILAADVGIRMGIRVVTPAEYAGVRDIVRKEIVKPMDAICGCPRLVAVSVQAMDGHDTDRDVRISVAVGVINSLNNGVNPFCNNLQALRACFDSRFCCLGRTPDLLPA